MSVSRLNCPIALCAELDKTPKFFHSFVLMHQQSFGLWGNIYIFSWWTLKGLFSWFQKKKVFLQKTFHRFYMGDHSYMQLCNEIWDYLGRQYSRGSYTYINVFQSSFMGHKWIIVVCDIVVQAKLGLAQLDISGDGRWHGGGNICTTKYYNIRTKRGCVSGECTTTTSYQAGTSSLNYSTNYRCTAL